MGNVRSCQFCRGTSILFCEYETCNRAASWKGCNWSHTNLDGVEFILNEISLLISIEASKNRSASNCVGILVTGDYQHLNKNLSIRVLSVNVDFCENFVVFQIDFRWDIYRNVKTSRWKRCDRLLIELKSHDPLIPAALLVSCNCLENRGWQLPLCCSSLKS